MITKKSKGNEKCKEKIRDSMFIVSEINGIIKPLKCQVQRRKFGGVMGENGIEQQKLSQSTKEGCTYIVE